MSVTGRLLVEQIITGDGDSGACSSYSVTEFCATSRLSRPAVVFSFQTGVLSSIKKAISWPIWVNLSPRYALFGVLFIGPNCAVVYQN